MRDVPLHIQVRGGHAGYLYQAADRARHYLRDKRAEARALAELGDTPERIAVNAILKTCHLDTEEEVREVVGIIREMGGYL